MIDMLLMRLTMKDIFEVWYRKMKHKMMKDDFKIRNKTAYFCKMKNRWTLKDFKFFKQTFLKTQSQITLIKNE